MRLLEFALGFIWPWATTTFTSGTTLEHLVRRSAIVRTRL